MAETKKPDTEIPNVNDLIGGIDAGDERLDESMRTSDSTGPGSDHLLVAQGNATIEALRRSPGSFYMEKRDKPGEFDLFDEVKVIILDSRNRQKLSDESRNTVCRSMDGKTNLDGTKQCRQCPDHQFQGGSCRGSKVLLAVWADNREAEPFIMHIGAQGISEYNKLRQGLERKNIPVFGVAVTFQTVERETSVKTFNWVPIPAKLDALTKPERAEMLILRQENIARLEGGEPVADQLGSDYQADDEGASLVPEGDLHAALTS